DPIAKFAAFLTSSGLATDEELRAIAEETEREANQAALDALHAPQPAKDTAAVWLYSPDVDPTSGMFDTPANPEGEPDTMLGAINRTLKDEMAINPRIVVFGEDVADASRKDALVEVP